MNLKRILLVIILGFAFSNYCLANSNIGTANSKQAIQQAKIMCKDIGYDLKSEKFKDCVLKLTIVNTQKQEKAKTADQEYIFTGEATFGKNKKSKKHNKKLAKYMKMPEKVLCIGYINKYGIFKKAKQAARAEAIQTRRIDCNPYMDAAYYHKKQRMIDIADATQRALDNNAESKRAIAEQATRNRNKNLNCRSRKVGSYVRTTCN